MNTRPHSPNKSSQSAWPRVRFGDVVHLNTDRSADPAADGIERYVAIEHIEPEDLRIRSWGLVAEGTTFTQRIRPGQTLFVKRRAYQRKVAVAEFDAVCSGDIYVLEPQDDRLLPELLPFLCQTDAFFEHAVNTSAGSLSPRTNWTQLAQYEFALPPLAEQRRIVRVLKAFQEIQEAFLDAQNATDTLFRSLLMELMSRGLLGESPVKTGNLVHPDSWQVVRLDSIAAVERGKFSHRPRNLPEFYGGIYPFVQTGDVGASRGRLKEVSQMLSEEGLQYSRSFPPETIFITIAAVIGATAITTAETWCTDSVVGIVIKEDQKVDVRFLEYALRYIRPYLEFQVATHTAQKNINLEILRPLIVPCPSIEIQKEVTAILSEVEDALEAQVIRLKDNRDVAHSFQQETLKGCI